MISREVKVKSKVGLHARPAAIFVQTANNYSSDISVEKNGKKVNGKSIMGIMSLGVANGENIVITVNGLDEKEAMEGLLSILENTLSDY